MAGLVVVLRGRRPIGEPEFGPSRSPRARTPPRLPRADTSRSLRDTGKPTARRPDPVPPPCRSRLRPATFIRWLARPARARMIAPGPPHAISASVPEGDSSSPRGRPDRADGRSDHARDPPRSPALSSTPACSGTYIPPFYPPPIPLWASIFSMLQVPNFDNAPLAESREKSKVSPNQSRVLALARRDG
jgi:hypothetical protein